MDEIEALGTTKPYLSERIPVSSLRGLLDLLRAEAEVIPALERPIPPITRDRKDDYLIAYAMAGGADVLVSGDNDLLTLGGIDALRMVSPKESLALLG